MVIVELDIVDICQHRPQSTVLMFYFNFKVPDNSGSRQHFEQVLAVLRMSI
ncbi:hypothetical protein SDC9_67113 [bioreactor metagenome]|uniref:Uncharacterized protein n=1 Tax=bioreactor metagenome TaxID=1076179 RepID=A0A644XXM9_9ZZZZ